MKKTPVYFVLEVLRPDRSIVYGQYMADNEYPLEKFGDAHSKARHEFIDSETLKVMYRPPVVVEAYDYYVGTNEDVVLAIYNSLKIANL